MNLAELKALPGWLVWKREGKLKVPYYASGGRRSGRQGAEADRAGLVPYDVAMAALGRGYSGVGLAMLDWGVVALDLDNVQDWDNARRLTAGTYAEVSPSGKGVRAFFMGSLEDMKQPGFEIFCHHGYVTFTANVLDPAWDLIAGSDSFAAVTDEIKALAARKVRREKTNGTAPPPMGFDEAQIKAALAAIDPSCGYDDWLTIGMAVHHETHGEGFDLWHEWSSGGDNYVGEEDCEGHWESFGKRINGEVITMRSLLKMAGEKGAAIGALGAPPARVDDFDDLGEAASPAGVGATVAPGGAQFVGVGPKGIPCTLSNVTAAAADPAWLGGQHVAFDEFKNSIVLSGDEKTWRMINNEDASWIRRLLGARGFKSEPRLELVREALSLAAVDRKFDSVRLWMDALPAWDGQARVESFMERYFSAPGDFGRAVSLYLWTALAGRVLRPGCQADMAPILVGGQGIGKTNGIRAMLPDIELYRELDFAEDAKERARRASGCMIMELNELNGLHTRAAGEIKAFISRREDEWRHNYKEYPIKYRRRCIIIGTTNDHHFLDDETGNRRFLPIVVGDVDVAGIERDRLQLWAEARVLHQKGGVAYRDAETMARTEHGKYEVVDLYLEQIEKWLETPEDLTNVAPCSLELLQTGDILMGIKLHKPNRMDVRAVVRAMTKLGWSYKSVRQATGKVTRSWKSTL